MHGDESIIHIKNGKGGLLYFNIVVPIEKGTGYVFRYVREMELASASTEVGIRVSVQPENSDWS